MADPMGDATRALYVLVVDDNADVRRAIRFLLARETGLEVIAEAASIEEMLGFGGGRRPNLILIDLELPGLDAPHLAAIRETSPDVSIVGMTSLPEAALNPDPAFDIVVDKTIGPEALLGALNQLTRHELA